MGSLSTEKYDFIVVGAGASGATLAARLANSSKHPSVLLLEAGGKNDNQEWRIDGERWLHRFNPASAWGYETVPQKHLDGIKISYDRGKGLGGSTAVNFSAWNVGPADDHDTIARMVGDSEWEWKKGAQPRYSRIENYHGDSDHLPKGYKKFFDPEPGSHGKNGPINVGVPGVWEKSMEEIMDIWIDSGAQHNTDGGSGNPLGLFVCPSSAYKGIRSTSADQLKPSPSNLHVVTDAQVAKVLFEKRTATGVELLDGRRFQANKEVILSAGSLDTPRILMHSGIGPADQLNKFAIPVIVNAPGVGQNLKDHHHINPVWKLQSHNKKRMEFYQSKELQAAARAQWETNQTGLLAEIACVFAMGFFKSAGVLASAEFEALPAATKKHLNAPTVPSYEILLNGPVAEYFIDPANTPPAASVFIFVLNSQSAGQATLQSADPAIPLLFDPNFLSHPYDRRVAIEGTREVLKVTQTEAFQQYTTGLLHGPQSESEEDILAYWKKTTGSTWHMTGTCKMGKQGEEGACVDKDFKLYGINNLRVADMSIVPLMPNNHTQTTAYLVGLMAGDRIVREYGLDGE